MIDYNENILRRLQSMELLYDHLAEGITKVFDKMEVIDKSMLSLEKEITDLIRCNINLVKEVI